MKYKTLIIRELAIFIAVVVGLLFWCAMGAFGADDNELAKAAVAVELAKLKLQSPATPTPTVDGYDPKLTVPPGWQWVKRGESPWKLEPKSAPEVTPVVPFRVGSTPGINAPNVAEASTSFPGGTVTGHTRTFALPGIRGGTNCSPGG